MDSQTDKKANVIRSLDWWTIGIYLALLVFGWISVCGASYNYGDVDIFSLDTRSGMQILWIASSALIGFIILLLDDRIFGYVAYFVYASMMALLVITIFFHHEVKGSNSWLFIGPVHLQPAEFAKFATALALAKVMSAYNFNMNIHKDMAKAIAIALLPMAFIILQNETGCALVYLAFFLMFYREGMTGSVLFTGISFVVYFVVGVGYKDVLLLDTTTSVGGFTVLFLIHSLSALLVYLYCYDKKQALLIFCSASAVTLLAFLFAQFVIPFNIMWAQLGVSIAIAGFLLYRRQKTRINRYLYIMVFSILSTAFIYATGPVMNNLLQEHQRTRVNVLLGVDNDIMKEGYNVNQSKIAIGSGGLKGKGFLNGTQTKLKFVPEQDTDFIFCTVGEEEGFLGSAGVLLLFLALILRLIIMSERQPLRFGRVYGYCVMSIYLFHVFINVGMVLGLTPVIGIPLPFFSYGGSSLWGFTILLFIFLRIDAGRNKIRV